MFLTIFLGHLFVQVERQTEEVVYEQVAIQVFIFRVYLCMNIFV